MPRMTKLAAAAAVMAAILPLSACGGDPTSGGGSGGDSSTITVGSANLARLVVDHEDPRRLPVPAHQSGVPGAGRGRLTAHVAQHGGAAASRAMRLLRGTSEPALGQEPCEELLGGAEDGATGRGVGAEVGAVGPALEVGVGVTAAPRRANRSRRCCARSRDERCPSSDDARVAGPVGGVTAGPLDACPAARPTETTVVPSPARAAIIWLVRRSRVRAARRRSRKSRVVGT